MDTIIVEDKKEFFIEFWNKEVLSKYSSDSFYKAETNQDNEIVLSLSTERNVIFVGRAYFLISSYGSERGIARLKLPILTKKGIKVPDLVWLSNSTLENEEDKTPYEGVPDICVEVVTSSDTEEGLREQIDALFEIGVKEFWLIKEDGNINFLSNGIGQIDGSGVLRGFPKCFELV